MLTRCVAVGPAPTAGMLLRSAVDSTVVLTLCPRNLFKVDIAQKPTLEWLDGRSDVAERKSPSDRRTERQW